MNVQRVLKKLPIANVNYQTVRWRKPSKPFWLGIAKSKRFVVHEPKKLPDDQQAELNRLKKGYEDLFRSHIHFIKNDPIVLEMQKIKELEAIEGTGSLELIIEESLKKNEAWNLETAALRDARLEAAAKARETNILEQIEKKEEMKRQRLERVEEIVRKEKEMSKSFVTLKNLNEAVEECINNVVDYNYCIDFNGIKHYGSKSLDPDPAVSVEEKESAAVSE